MTIPLPQATILLITFNQEDKVREAIAGALAQTYSPLEIIISDDCSTDQTWREIEESVAAYQGPHRIRLNRNQQNMGIGAHLSKLAAMASGELLFVAAGDDVSLPCRCEVVVDAWLKADRKPDLISADLVDMDLDGRLHDVIQPTDLTGMTLDDWLLRQPYVIGAAHAWHRRLFDRFGPLPPGVAGEDFIMTFRAVTSGGAISVRQPLVNYRRGGISRRVRAMDAQTVIRRILKNNSHALVEIPQVIRDAAIIGQQERVRQHFAEKLAREEFIKSIFAARSRREKTFLFFCNRDVKWPARIRIYFYAAWPVIYTPFFCLKKIFSAARG